AHGNGGCAAGGFAHGHAGGHHADGGHCFVGCGDASAGYEQTVDNCRHQAAVGNVVAVAAPFESTTVVVGVMEVDGIAGDGDRVVESATAENIVPSHHVLANDAACFANA